MISFTSSQKYYFYSGPMDMRKDIDTISEVVRSQMGLDPYIEESVFIFMSKNLRTMKILYRGRRRFELTKIRLDDEKFFLPVFDEQRSCYKICWSDFVTLIEGVQVTKMQIKEDVVWLFNYLVISVLVIKNLQKKLAYVRKK